MLSAIKRSGVNLATVDQQTMISKTSIQMIQFQEQIETQHSIPLAHTELSKVQLYSAPLKDKDQLKRVVLFSDYPHDESEAIMTT